MSFLDNLENNLKALESRDEGGMDEDRRRAVERARSLAEAPWAYRLKNEPYAQALMQQATVAGRQRRTKVNLAWIDTTLRLEARGQRLELRPTPDGIVAVFLRGSEEITRQPIDLAHDPKKLTAEWMPIIEEQKRLDDLAEAADAEAAAANEAMPS
jgi:hypothetical protein